jgi:ribosomal protein S19E (S16A)
MGRGLSDLQKAILRHVATQVTVCRAMLLSEHFGWQRTKGRAVRDFGKNFRPAAIGEAKYRKDSASLSRALRRLVVRGLLENTYGRQLTEKGRELVRSLGLQPDDTPQPSREELLQNLKALLGGTPNG